MELLPIYGRKAARIDIVGVPESNETKDRWAEAGMFGKFEANDLGAEYGERSIE